jgi:hypothetical protein
VSKRCPRGLAVAFAGYVALALAFFWPLPLHLTTRVTGALSNDTGVYLWNLWHFRHQIGRRRSPFFTDTVLSLTPPTDLSLHNYTTFADILAFPLLPWVGLVAAFNLICIGLTILTAMCTFRLARRVVGKAPEAWLVGAAFAFSPVLVARSTGHFSLVAAAPLPVFVLCLINASQTGRLRWGFAAGAVMAWAVTCDPYYGIFCILIAAGYLATEWLHVQTSGFDRNRCRGIGRVLELSAACSAGLAAFILATGGGRFVFLGHVVTVQTLYTPMLALVVSLILRACIALRPRVSLTQRPQPLRAVKFALAAAVACVLPLLPILHAYTYRFADGGVLHKPVYWRSSPRGVDLLAFLIPNPNHPLFGGPWREWLSHQALGLLENVAALTLVCSCVVAIAVWRCCFKPPAQWLLLPALFLALALGPFLHVAGVNTQVPGPWAFFRYLPAISAARLPTRLAIPAMLAFTVLFGLALKCIADRHPRHRRAIVGVVTGALLFELLPAPRRLYSAEVPAIYRIIAEDPRDVRVLELPLGFRDGESSLGDFNPAFQYYQTFHRKRLVGGYLSRISSNEIRRQRRASPTVRALISLSEGKSLNPELLRMFRRRGPRFIQRTNIGYVVLAENASPTLRQFAKEAFGLIRIGESDGLELYKPDPVHVQRAFSLISLRRD